jgi:hypothetical protein
LRHSGGSGGSARPRNEGRGREESGRVSRGFGRGARLDAPLASDGNSAEVWAPEGEDGDGSSARSPLRLVRRAYFEEQRDRMRPS